MKLCLVCPCLKKKTTSRVQESCYKCLEGVGNRCGRIILAQAIMYALIGGLVMSDKCPNPCTGTVNFFVNFFLTTMYETIKIICVQFAFIIAPYQINMVCGFVKININEWEYQKSLEEWREKFHPGQKKCTPKKLAKYFSIPYLFYIYTWDFTSSEYEGELEKDIEMENVKPDNGTEEVPTKNPVGGSTDIIVSESNSDLARV